MSIEGMDGPATKTAPDDKGTTSFLFAFVYPVLTFLAAYAIGIGFGFLMPLHDARVRRAEMTDTRLQQLDGAVKAIIATGGAREAGEALAGLAIYRQMAVGDAINTDIMMQAQAENLANLIFAGGPDGMIVDWAKEIEDRIDRERSSKATLGK